MHSKDVSARDTIAMQVINKLDLTEKYMLFLAPGILVINQSQSVALITIIL